MRWKWCSLFLLSLLMIGVGQIPGRILGSVPAVEYLSPRVEVNTNQISCIGVVYASRQTEIYFDLPVYADQVLVAVGEQVKTGEQLASLDVEKTRAILANAAAFEVGNFADKLSESSDAVKAISGGSLTTEDYLALLEDYTSTYGLNRYQETYYLEDQVTAPISGTVTQVNLIPNTLFQSPQAAFVISDLSSCKVVASVSQADMDQIKVGDTAVITASGVSGQEYHGVLSKIYPTSKRGYSGTVQEAMVDVEITLKEKNTLLKPGYTVTAQIFSANPEEMLTIPYESVNQDENNQEYVYLLQGGKAVRRDIITGKQALGRVQVLEGLTEEDLLVFDAQGILSASSPVYIKGEASYD